MFPNHDDFYDHISKSTTDGLLVAFKSSLFALSANVRTFYRFLSTKVYIHIELSFDRVTLARRELASCPATARATTTTATITTTTTRYYNKSISLSLFASI